MTHSTVSTRALSILAVALLLSVATATTASAQGFVAPFIGYDFSGDSGCATIDCEEKHLNFGVAVGSMGGLFGIELDFGYAPDFFGESATTSSNALTVMGNVLIGPKIGPVQPFVLAGLGLIKTKFEVDSAGLLDNSTNDFGWDVGGGLMIFFGDHVGVRGDIRYFHAFQDFDLLGLTLDGEKLDFGRASAGVVFKF